MQLDLSAYATSATAEDGKFHPAIQQGLTVMYWPNIKFATEDEAYKRAGLALKDAWDAANAVSSQWNMLKL